MGAFADFLIIDVLNLRPGFERAPVLKDEHVAERSRIGITDHFRYNMARQGEGEDRRNHGGEWR